jgi:hypothetical protein
MRQQQRNTSKRKVLPVCLWLLVIFLLVACGDPTVTATFSPATSTTPSASNFTTTPPTVAATTARPNTTTASRPNATATRTVATGEETELARDLSERAVIRTFTDVQGRTVRLTFGRGNGRSGDYGWAHIRGKHIYGIWYDGGTITTFPKALGTKTLSEVVALIEKSVKDKNPDEQNNGRRGYVYQVPGTNRDVFTVVGGDGTIITSYPVPRGSKDEDA